MSASRRYGKLIPLKGVIMPSPYTAKESIIENAEALAANLGMRYIAVSLGGLFSEYLAAIEGVLQGANLT